MTALDRPDFNASDSGEPSASSPGRRAVPTASPAKPRGPITMLLDLFSSIWFGVILLTLLFLYCSIGSSGVPTQLWIFDPAAWEYGHVRQWRGIELTEFEWFHWWPFDVLIALICANI